MNELGGLVHTSSPSLDEMIVADFLRNTITAPDSPLPVIVTCVPPATGPKSGETLVTAGGPGGLLLLAV